MHHHFFESFQTFLHSHGFDHQNLHAAKLRIHRVRFGLVLASPNSPNWIFRIYENGRYHWKSTDNITPEHLIGKHLDAYKMTREFAKQYQEQGPLQPT